MMGTIYISYAYPAPRTSLREKRGTHANDCLMGWKDFITTKDLEVQVVARGL